MPKKDQNQYDMCMKSIVQNTNGKSRKIIDNRIKISNNALKKLYAANFDQERIDALDHLIKFFAGGCHQIAKNHNLKNHNYLPFFIQEYVSTFDSGIDEQFSGVLFTCPFPNRIKNNVLEIYPIETAFNIFIGMYESALKGGIIKSPSEYKTDVFDDHFSDDDDEKTKEIWLELLL